MAGAIIGHKEKEEKEEKRVRDASRVFAVAAKQGLTSGRWRNGTKQMVFHLKPK